MPDFPIEIDLVDSSHTIRIRVALPFAFLNTSFAATPSLQREFRHKLALRFVSDGEANPTNT